MPRPDEGLIHAWLDGQLSPEEATRVEQMVTTNAEWAAAAAEARGVIAASSRILLALDRVPSGVVPQRTVAPVARRLPWWTKMAAAVVLMAGVSTMVMRRTSEPEIAPPPQTTAAAGAAVAPVAPVVAPSATPAPVVRAAKAPATTTPAAPAAAPTAAVAQVGGVSNEQAKSTVAADQASRVQQLDEARQGAAQVMAQRTSGEMRRELPMAVPARESARDVAAPSPFAARARLTTGGCYELRENRTSAVVGVVMRGARMQGDTLLLTPARAPSPVRAWVVAADSVVHGVLTLEPEGRGMVLVSALPVACPAP